MLVIALTGGIGSGKSLAAEYFARLGAKVIDADDLARKAIERGSTGFDAVVTEFGDSILTNGDIDRRALAQIVFADPSRRKSLESIIHPRVRESYESYAKLLDEKDILIYEIPLLAESGSKSRFDYVVTVESPLEQRIERLRQKGMHLSDIEARVASQATPSERSAVADLTLVNDGSPEELFNKIESIWTNVIPNIGDQKS